MQDFQFSTLPYARPDFAALAEKGRALVAKIKSAKVFSEVESAIAEQEALFSGLFTQQTIASVRHTIDTSDPFYEEENNCFNSELPKLSEVMVEFSKALYESPFKEEIDERYGEMFLKGTELSIKSFTPENVPLMIEENELTTEYERLMAQAKIPFRGEEYNLYGIQKFFTDPDRETRKGAFAAYSGFYAGLEDKLEEIFDKLVKNRTQQAKNLGFSSFTELGYLQQGRTDYGKEEVASFRAQVKEVLVPACDELYRAQAKRIGVDAIYAYDEKLIYPDGNAEPIGDREFLVKEAQKMYHELSPELGEFVDYMIEHELMDLDNKPNKASTGYCTYLPDYQAPFVFSCFNHTTFDVEVLTHEFGHAFAGYEAFRHQELLDYSSCSTDIAEIHSMSMEQFAYPYAERFFGAGAEKYRFQHLQEAITFVPFGVAVDEFQHIVYENPDLTPKERTYEWHKLEEKYMPWRKYSSDPFMERGGYWYHKLHIFLYPFYYINYTLTTMGAMEFKKRYAEQKEEAMADYLALCRAGGSRSYLKTLALARLSVPFEAGTVAKVMEYPLAILKKNIEKEN